MKSLPGQQDAAAKDQEIAELQARLAEAEETLRAIRSGEVDALVVSRPEGDQIFTLQGAETPYRILIEEMNEGALLVAPEGTLLYANARFAALAGKPLEQVIGGALRNFFVAADQPRLDALLKAAVRAGLREEFQLQREKGAVCPVEVSLRSMQGEHIEGFSVVVTDLTRRKANEAALHRSLAELEAFSYSLSHDMRAPLRAIQSFTQIALDDNEGKFDQGTTDLLHKVVHATHRMDSLIRDVLALSRVSRAEISVAPVDVDKLLREIIHERPELQAPKAEIRIESPLLPINAHPASLTQCLTNLLGNAVKFVAPGVRPRVRVWSERRSVARLEAEHAEHAAHALHASRVRLWIEDNGIGIEPAGRDKIFQIFHRLNKGYEGTGIGLAIVRRAVERMHGAVGVESEPGKGSRFWLELPGAS